ncbi:MAG: uracil-DNA glycosylase [Thioalkalispiraceae bacterium]
MTARQRAYLMTMGITTWVDQSAQEMVASDETSSAGIANPATTNALNQTKQSLDIASLEWAELAEQVASCRLCDLHSSRTQAVFGVGNPLADLMFVGEAPGADEDRQGEPFVGRAGQLLNEMLRAIGLQRQQVYIANILKCRPPNNRDPRPEEVEQCVPYLYRQIALIQPKLIVAVGRIAAQRLLKTDISLSKLRNKIHTLPETQTPFIVTYHPAYLLRSPLEKRKAWQDLLFVKQTLNSSR